MPLSVHIVLNTADYFWLFKQSYSELHLCSSGEKKQQAVGFHWERKRAGLGQETQADFPGGKPY